MHPLLCRLLHEVHASSSWWRSALGTGGSPDETDPGILRLTKLLAKADGNRGSRLVGRRFVRRPEHGMVDDSFDVIGAWLNDDDSGATAEGGHRPRGGITRDAFESRSGGAAKAARAGLVRFPRSARDDDAILI